MVKTKIGIIFVYENATKHLNFYTMAYKITENCAACGTCIDECPNGAISAGDKIAETAVMDSSVRKVSGQMSFLIPRTSNAKLRLVVWLDGVDMKNEHGEKNMLFSLTFRGESV